MGVCVVGSSASSVAASRVSHEPFCWVGRLGVSGRHVVGFRGRCRGRGTLPLSEGATSASPLVHGGAVCEQVLGLTDGTHWWHFDKPAPQHRVRWVHGKGGAPGTADPPSRGQPQGSGLAGRTGNTGGELGGLLARLWNHRGPALRRGTSSRHGGSGGVHGPAMVPITARWRPRRRRSAGGRSGGQARAQQPRLPGCSGLSDVVTCNPEPPLRIGLGPRRWGRDRCGPGGCWASRCS